MDDVKSVLLLGRLRIHRSILLSVFYIFLKIIFKRLELDSIMYLGSLCSSHDTKQLQTNLIAWLTSVYYVFVLLQWWKIAWLYQVFDLLLIKGIQLPPTKAFSVLSNKL